MPCGVPMSSEVQQSGGISSFLGFVGSYDLYFHNSVVILQVIGEVVEIVCLLNSSL